MDRLFSETDSSNSSPKKPLGELLAEAGLVSIHQIEIALQEQKNHDLRFGEILAAHSWIRQQTADFFAEKWSSIIQKQATRPLVFYLYAAALLDKKQILLLKQRQKQENVKIRLHSLAVEQGYVKQQTIDFFLRYLFGVHQDSVLSFATPYQIIKSYINGQNNFKNIELIQAPLSRVSLKKVVLDGSNLRQAKLNHSNLSYSSLIKANLSFADLKLANLSHTNFQQASLIEANLSQSNLEYTNFQAANLQEVDLRKANLNNVNMLSADLRGAKLKSARFNNVYYDDRTLFDANFDPIQAGWKIKS